MFVLQIQQKYDEIDSMQLLKEEESRKVLQLEAKLGESKQREEHVREEKEHLSRTIENLHKQLAESQVSFDMLKVNED